jgi:hypothetical protein
LRETAEADPEQHGIWGELGAAQIQLGMNTDAETGLKAALARQPEDSSTSDFDRDGRIDAAVTTLNAPIELWWNQTPQRNWLQLRLEGKRSNRSAIGGARNLQR